MDRIDAQTPRPTPQPPRPCPIASRPATNADCATDYRQGASTRSALGKQVDPFIR